jgi:protein BCP1
LPVLTLPPQELVDVDFEFFDPIADIDWHGVKRLLAQLLQADAPLFHLNLLTDLILSQPLVGSTVKCDGRESDPYAFLSVLNLNVHTVRFLSQCQAPLADRVSKGSPFN